MLVIRLMRFYLHEMPLADIVLTIRSWALAEKSPAFSCISNTERAWNSVFFKSPVA